MGLAFKASPQSLAFKTQPHLPKFHNFPNRTTVRDQMPKHSQPVEDISYPHRDAKFLYFSYPSYLHYINSMPFLNKPQDLNDSNSSIFIVVLCGFSCVWEVCSHVQTDRGGKVSVHMSMYACKGQDRHWWRDKVYSLIALHLSIEAGSLNWTQCSRIWLI